jgi:hypothetical protein
LYLLYAAKKPCHEQRPLPRMEFMSRRPVFVRG